MQISSFGGQWPPFCFKMSAFLLTVALES